MLDKKVIFLNSGAKTSNEVRFLPAATPAAAPKVVAPREADHEYDVDHYNGELYITTNRGAKNFRVARAPIADPSEPNWKPFIDHRPAVRIGGLTFFANHLVVSEREGGLSYLRVIDLRTSAAHRIATDEPDYALSLAPNPEFDTVTVRFNYQSMVTPASVYDYDLTPRAGRSEADRRMGGTTRRLPSSALVVSRDGTRVPISMVIARATGRDGTRRCCCLPGCTRLAAPRSVTV